MMYRFGLIITLLLLVVVGTACRQSAEGDSAVINLTIEGLEDAEVGAARLMLTLKDRYNNPITDAKRVALRGDMSHAGMTPVFAQGRHTEDGVYRVDLLWTMAGDWILTVDVTLADDSEVSREFRFSVKE